MQRLLRDHDARKMNRGSRLFLSEFSERTGHFCDCFSKQLLHLSNSCLLRLVIEQVVSFQRVGGDAVKLVSVVVVWVKVFGRTF